MNKRLVSGYFASNLTGSELRGIPTQPIPRVVVPGPARHNGKSAETLPQSIRYMGEGIRRYRYQPIIGIGNRQRDVMGVDVRYGVSSYNTVGMYRPPTAIANPTWRIANVTNGDIKRIEKLQKDRRSTTG